MSWFRKYRQHTIAGLQNQLAKTTVTDWMKRGKIPTAILLTGPRGTGKTTTARIIAAMVNDPANVASVQANFFGKGTLTPYQEPDESQELLARIWQGSSLVVQEHDAASQRGIDDIRWLKEQAFLPPVEGVVKVFILDEVHMLTTEAFNALLKLLEEPPAHAIFILATTDVEKVPATIVSRCSVVQFHRASSAELQQALQAIADQENLKIDLNALEQLAQSADGSFRDAIKHLELLANRSNSITPELIGELFPLFTSEITDMVQALVARDAVAVAKQFELWRDRNVSLRSLHGQLISLLHTQMLKGYGVVAGEPIWSIPVVTFLLKEFAQVSIADPAPIPLLPLELKCFELLQRSGSGKKPITKSTPSEPEPKVTEPLHSSTSKIIVSAPEPSVVPASKPAPKVEITDSSAKEGKAAEFGAIPAPEIVIEKWPTFVQTVRDKNTTLGAILQSVEPIKTEAGELAVQVFYEFHLQQLQLPKFQVLLLEIVEAVFGKAWKIPLVLATQKPDIEMGALI